MKLTMDDFQEFADFISSIKCCHTCANCLPIGKGDHICANYVPEPLVLDDYEPTDDYYYCDGDAYEGVDDDDSDPFGYY